MEALPAPSTETKVDAGTKNRLFWISLDAVALFFWLYAIIKVFVFDIDIYLASLASPSLVWLLSYKFLFLLGSILVGMLLTRSVALAFAVAYVTLFPKPRSSTRQVELAGLRFSR